MRGLFLVVAITALSLAGIGSSVTSKRSLDTRQLLDGYQLRGVSSGYLQYGESAVPPGSTVDADVVVNAKESFILYVDPTLGDDSNNGQDQTNQGNNLGPKATLEGAIGTAQSLPFDTVFIYAEPGAYNRNEEGKLDPDLNAGGNDSDGVRIEGAKSIVLYVQETNDKRTAAFPSAVEIDLADTATLTIISTQGEYSDLSGLTAAVEFQSTLELFSGALSNSLNRDTTGTVKVVGESVVHSGSNLVVGEIFQFRNHTLVAEGAHVRVDHTLYIHDSTLTNQGAIEVYGELSSFYEGSDLLDREHEIRVLNEVNGVIALHNEAELYGSETLLNKGIIRSSGVDTRLAFTLENHGTVEVTSGEFLVSGRPVSADAGVFTASNSAHLSLLMDSLSGARLSGSGSLRVDPLNNSSAILDGVFDVTGSTIFFDSDLVEEAEIVNLGTHVTFAGTSALLKAIDQPFPALTIYGEFETVSAITADSLTLQANLTDCSNNEIRSVHSIHFNSTTIGQSCVVTIGGTGTITENVTPSGGIVVDAGASVTNQGRLSGTGFIQIRPGGTLIHTAESASIGESVSVINTEASLIIQGNAGDILGYLDNTGRILLDPTTNSNSLDVKGEFIQEFPGSIEGSGSVVLDADYVAFGGSIAPSASSVHGTLRIIGDYEPTDSSRLELDIRDGLQIDGKLAPKGSLIVKDFRENSSPQDCLPSQNGLLPLITFGELSGDFYEYTAPRFYFEDGTESRFEATPVLDEGSFSLRVSAPNSRPVAVDDFYPIVSDTSEVFFPLANDSDPDGDELRIFQYFEIGNSRAKILADWESTGPCRGTYTNFRVVRPETYRGPDSLVYFILDEYGGIDTALVRLRYLTADEVSTHEPDFVDNLVLSNVYPNPGSDRISISVGIPSTNDVVVAMYDLVGRAIHRREFSNVDPGRIQVLDFRLPNSLAAGLYIIVVSVDGDKSTAVSRKVVVLQ